MEFHQRCRFNKIHYEKFYLLNLEKFDDKIIFSISGSTSNIYKVSLYLLGKRIFCNCPDAKSHAKKNHCLCKHVCFIIFCVLKNCVNKDNTDLWTNHYFSNEELIHLVEKINSLNLNQNEHTSEEMFIRYELLKNKDPKEKFKIKKEIKEDDYCIICFEEFKVKKNICQCPMCNSILHSICMNKWLNTGKISCPYCRSEVWENFNTNNMYNNLNDA